MSVFLPVEIQGVRHKTKLSIVDFIYSKNESNKNIGVYMIYCNGNGKVYIGSTSRSFKHRMSKHLHSLRNNKKDCVVLQECYNKYGESSFDVTIIEIVRDKRDVVSRETHYLEYILRSSSDFVYFKKHGMNICRIGGSTLGIKIRRDVVDRLTKLKTGRKQTPEHVENTRRANIGRKCSLLTRLRISQSNKGRANTIETRLKIGAANRGKIHATKRKPVYQLSKDGIVVKKYSHVQGVRAFGFNAGNVHACCIGKRRFYRKSIWCFSQITE